MKTLSSTLDPTRWAAGQFTRPTVHSFKLCIGSDCCRAQQINKYHGFLKAVIPKHF